jgi:hypothetical protein
LIFELDGQCVAEPKHWRAAKNGNGAQAWFVGQAVALREMSWELAREKSQPQSEINRWRGLIWLMVRAGKIDENLPTPPDSTFRPNTENFERVQKWRDDLAKAATALPWTDQLSQTALAALAGSPADFRETVPQPVQARRASRLVRALDRLTRALPEVRQNKPLNAALNQLFNDAQSLPDFKPAAFAAHLEEFQKLIPPSKS